MVTSVRIPATRGLSVLWAVSFLPVLLGAAEVEGQWGSDRGRQPTLQEGVQEYDWVMLDAEGGCFGGDRCRSSGPGLALPLQARPVLAVRFHAHDDVGKRHGGTVLVRIDRQIIEPALDVSQYGELYELPVDGLRGQMLVLEPASNDEVVISEVAVRYEPDRGSHWPRSGHGMPGGWEAYPEAGRCIGGTRCPIPGNHLEVPLYAAPVTGLRFHAHDRVGDRGKGHVQVRIDEVIVAPDIDIKKDGMVHELEIPELRGERLIIEETAGDEVVIEDIEICYAAVAPSPGQRHGGDGWRSYEVSACIGGSRCPDPGNLLELPLEGGPVTAVRFFAHDRVGDRGRAHLQLRIDHTVIAPDIDVRKDGEVHEVAVPEVYGRQLVFEEIGGDEAIIEDVEVQYGSRGSGYHGRPRHWQGGQGGRWQSYAAAGGCIGGKRCRHNGEEIRISLDPAPVLRIRFLARDDVGDRHTGRLRVAIDSSVLERDLDVPKQGDHFELDVNGIRGRELVFTNTTGDEVVVEEIEVEYGY